MHFVRYFWPVLEPSREFVDGWVLHTMADHLEAVERGEITRLLVAVPPGFMKSLMINVFFPTWVWSAQNKPWLRGLSFSYAAHLTERDNEKCRTLIQSKQFQELWGHRFKLASDSKIKISNDHQGWLLASSVGGITTGERGDILRCFPYGESVLTEEGPIPIGDIVTKRLPVKVWSTNVNTGKVSLQSIGAWRHNPGAPLVKVTFSDGNTLRCTPDHRIWTSAGWRQAQNLRPGQMLPKFSLPDFADGVGLDAHPCRNLAGCFAGMNNLLHLGFRKFGEFVRFANRTITSAVGAGMLDAPSGADLPPGYAELFPGATEANVGDCAGSNIILHRKSAVGFVGLGSYLSDKIFCQMRRSVFESPVNFTVRNILSPGSVFKIIKSWICAVTVSVSDFLPFGARANKGDSYQLMAKPVFGLARSSHSDARISLVEDRSKYPAFEFALAASIGNYSGKAANSAEIGDRVKPFVAHNREPGFVNVVSVEDFGHVDETFCLTIPETHTIGLALGQDFICCSNCDDPHNCVQGESERVRTETVRWFRESISSRLNDMKKSSIIVVHQRIHEEDVAGSIIADPEGMDYERLIIPMRWETDYPFDTKTCLGYEDPRTKDGELAWPERFPDDEVTKLERNLGPFAASAQLQQNPEPRGGGIIKRNWWRVWEDKKSLNEDGKLEKVAKFPYCDYRIVSVDPAFTEKEENDPSGITVWGTFRHPETNEPGLILMYAMEKRLQIHGDTSPKFPGESQKAYAARCGDGWGLVEWLWHCCETYDAHMLVIEGKASGHSVYQEIERRQDYRKWGTTLMDTGRLDKTARVYSVQGLFSQGLIWAPDRDWATKVIEQFSAFPKARNDDLVDASCQALRTLRDMGMLQFQDEREYEEYYEGNKPVTTQPLYPV